MAPLPIEQVREHIQTFLLFATAHSEMLFHIGRLEAGTTGLGDEALATLFATAPPNCVMPIQWQLFHTHSKRVSRPIDSVKARAHG